MKCEGCQKEIAELEYTLAEVSFTHNFDWQSPRPEISRPKTGQMLAPWPLYLLRLLDSSGGQGLCSWGDELVIILLVNSGTYIVQSKTSILRLPSIFTHCMSHRVHPVYSLCPVYQVHSVYSNHALSLSTCQRHQWNPEFVIIRVWHFWFRNHYVIQCTVVIMNGSVSPDIIIVATGGKKKMRWLREKVFDMLWMWKRFRYDFSLYIMILYTDEGSLQGVSE